MTDSDYMRRALDLAAQGRGLTHPNPMVGAVAVQNGTVIGEGFHPGPGQPHAEVFALKNMPEGAPGVALYVTLEPCAFHGRTPPCADLVIQKGVSRVVCAMADPDVRVSGRGIEKLKAAGIAVSAGLLEAEARALNQAYIKHRTTGLPFVALKLAQTLDGCIATTSGDSKWITSEASRTRGHAMRAQADAILIGSGTVQADNPALSVRLAPGRSPVKIALDSRLEISPKAKIFSGAPLVIATAEGAPQARIATLEAAGAQIWCLPAHNGRPDLTHVLRKAADAGWLHVLIEGGAQVAASALKAGLVDRLFVFIAPKLLGAGLPSIGALGIAHIAEAIALQDIHIERIGDDLLYSARPVVNQKSSYGMRTK